MTHILGLYGSPRIGGISALLLDKALETAAIAGAQVEALHLDKLDLLPCDGCEACSKGAPCVHAPDDASRALESLYQANVLILACPVYFFGVPAQLKSLIDRSQIYWWRGEERRRHGPPQRPAYTIVTAGQNRPDEFVGVLGSLSAFLFSLDFKPQAPFLVPGADSIDPLDPKSPFLEGAIELGLAAANAKPLET